jgi:hypothetical protein
MLSSQASEFSQAEDRNRLTPYELTIIIITETLRLSRRKGKRVRNEIHITSNYFASIDNGKDMPTGTA